ncbi:hypothetical protein RHGRI_003243 [Rhododendron griersonianum]|uniref:Uncharacterized protein n=1 Tax=Rhododendron griersonianum TaxID=479676 RepID=A0AAV6L6U3_9ERIC|nr:hypothetical protein RHGRI_003243 [Rhododendron griersonianum]
MVMEAVLEDMGEGTMQCLDHPYKSHTPPGGICAFCLQEKLGKLVSSSFPVAIFPSASSSPSPSFRSDSTLSVRQNTQNDPHYHHNSRRPSRIPFFASSGQKKDNNNNIIRSVDPVVFKRSKSTSTGGGGGMHFMDSYSEFNSPRKRGFWSFLRHHNTSSNKTSKEICYGTPSTSTMRAFPQRSQRIEEETAAEEPSIDSPNHARVSRSRSVGCGSRSFSGDFFERISTGFGDCTLRRVESQREGKPRATPGRRGGGGQDCIKERVKCGGIFSGFMIASSSSSSSSSSHWVSSSSAEAAAAATATPGAAAGHLFHGRSKSWGWAFASPIRGFSKPPLKREGSNKNATTATPNLNAIPSLLTVGS